MISMYVLLECLLELDKSSALCMVDNLCAAIIMEFPRLYFIYAYYSE